MSGEERLIRAIVTNDQVDFAHNDVANAAWFFRQRLAESVEANERSDGLFLDMMALVTMTAFSLEGYVNFLGAQLIRTRGDPDIAELAWRYFERRSARDKIKAIAKLIGATIDWNARPFSTVGSLFELRDMFAHPKEHRPDQRSFEAVGTETELKTMLRDYRPEYEKRLTWEFATTAHDDVEAIWSELLDGSGINPRTSFSGGSQGIEFLEHVDHKGE